MLWLIHQRKPRLAAAYVLQYFVLASPALLIAGSAGQYLYGAALPVAAVFALAFRQEEGVWIKVCASSLIGVLLAHSAAVQFHLYGAAKVQTRLHDVVSGIVTSHDAACGHESTQFAIVPDRGAAARTGMPQPAWAAGPAFACAPSSICSPQGVVWRELEPARLSGVEGHFQHCLERLAGVRAYMMHEYLWGEVRFDVTSPKGFAPADSLIASEVFEHVPPPVGAAFSGAFNTLKPRGLLALTAPFDRRLKQAIEHFPELHDYRVVQRKAPLAWRCKSSPHRFDLINHTEDGREQRFTDVRLHGGVGVTLEMLFSLGDLMTHLAAAGFADVAVRDDDCLGRGVVWLSPNSTPIVARKPLVERT